MRVACLPLAPLVAALALASGTLPAQENPPLQYALALRARYLPLESVRDGTVPPPSVGSVGGGPPILCCQSKSFHHASMGRMWKRKRLVHDGAHILLTRARRSRRGGQRV